MRILLLSNGHGEDLSGALLAAELVAQGARVAAMPLVGLGNAYRQRGIALVGDTLEISTGGLGYTQRGGQLREIWEGQLSHLFRQLLALRRCRQSFDRVVAVGDVIPVLGAWLAGLPAAAYLVAYSSHYEGRLRLPWPCSWLLRRRQFQLLWARDALTAADLSAQLERRVDFAGNPFFDAVSTSKDLGAAPARPAGTTPTLLLLPGSRLPEAERNLALMLRLIPQLKAGGLQLAAALVPALDQRALEPLARRCCWQLEPASGEAPPALRRGPCRLMLHWGRFAALLGQADLVLSMAGTASEQAVGLAIPVVQLAGEGPQFTAGFAEAQRRLLGPGVFCAAGAPGSDEALQGTAELIDQLLQPAYRAELQPQLTRLAHQRIGEAGGSSRLAQAILGCNGPRSPHG